MRSRSARLILATVMLLAVTSCADRRGMFGGGDAGEAIEREGAAISKPIPNVTVFVPRTSSDRREPFGDAQLRAIVPAMKQLEKFNALNVSGSSMTDAGIAELRAVTQLERLDVCDTAVTAEGLAGLGGLPKLATVTVSRGQLTPDAMGALKRALPRTKVVEFGSAASAPSAVRGVEPQHVITAPADEKYKYDAYGPWQYSVFTGVNRGNIYTAATRPSTGPVDDSQLFPADDADW